MKRTLFFALATFVLLGVIAISTYAQILVKPEAKKGEEQKGKVQKFELKFDDGHKGKVQRFELKQNRGAKKVQPKKAQPKKLQQQQEKQEPQTLRFRLLQNGRVQELQRRLQQLRRLQQQPQRGQRQFQRGCQQRPQRRQQQPQRGCQQQQRPQRQRHMQQNQRKMQDKRTQKLQDKKQNKGMLQELVKKFKQLSPEKKQQLLKMLTSPEVKELVMTHMQYIKELLDGERKLTPELLLKHINAFRDLEKMFKDFFKPEPKKQFKEFPFPIEPKEIEKYKKLAERLMKLPPEQRKGAIERLMQSPEHKEMLEKLMQNPEARKMLEQFMKQLMGEDKKVQPKPHREKPEHPIPPINKYAEKLQKMRDKIMQLPPEQRREAMKKMLESKEYKELQNKMMEERKKLREQHKDKVQPAPRVPKELMERYQKMMDKIRALPQEERREAMQKLMQSDEYKKLMQKMQEYRQQAPKIEPRRVHPENIRPVKPELPKELSDAYRKMMNRINELKPRERREAMQKLMQSEEYKKLMEKIHEFYKQQQTKPDGFDKPKVQELKLKDHGSLKLSDEASKLLQEFRNEVMKLDPENRIEGVKKLMQDPKYKKLFDKMKQFAPEK